MPSNYDFPIGFPADARPVSLTTEERNAFLKKVYGFVLLGLVSSGLGAYAALSVGAVGSIAAHPWISILLFFGLYIGALKGRQVEGLNVVLLIAFTGFSGAFISPAVAFAGPAATGNALAATCTVFVGLSIYAATTKRDFSFLGGTLFVAIWALIITQLLNIFVFKSPAITGAYSAVGALIFSGFILFDTWRLMRTEAFNEPIGFALNLYLDFINLFLLLLNLFGGGGRERR
jgi:FtsH-binding integral membrane protein